jgi:hypothetical protein
MRRELCAQAIDERVIAVGFAPAQMNLYRVDEHVAEYVLPRTWGGVIMTPTITESS